MAVPEEKANNSLNFIEDELDYLERHEGFWNDDRKRLASIARRFAALADAHDDRAPLPIREE